MYDVTSRRSFESLDMWLREANKYGGENLTVFVVANKVKSLLFKHLYPYLSFY